MNEVTINGKTYTPEQIMTIGREKAILWGGNCVDYVNCEKAKEVVFNCTEAGEYFIVKIPYESIIKEIHLL